jgi:membrane-bound lytic murein transglycosylase B
MKVDRGCQGIVIGAVLALAALSGCASQPVGGGSAADQGPASATPAATPKSKQTRQAARPQPATRDYRAATVTGDFAGDPDVDRFIGRMTATHGFSREYLAGVLSQAERKQWIIDQLDRDRPTGGPPRPGGWSRYREKFVTDRHISGGAEFWRENARELDRASRQYGVPPEYIVGIIGVETFYGRNVGTFRVVDALATLAFEYPRRGDYFSGELESFLVMARDERIDPLTPKGSYAGAMGLGQFMPTSFMKWAVDFNGDGHKDLWDPADAIGSVANYFKAHGWHGGQPVVTAAAATGGRARMLDAGFDTSYSLSMLASHDIRPASQAAQREDLRLLRLSTYSGDEYWLGYHNFYVITRYNHSTNYAMAVHQLAQAIKQRYGAMMVAQR